MTDLCDEVDAEATCDACAQRALEADPGNPEAYRVLANLRLCQKKATEAAPLAERAAAICASYYPADEEAEEEAVEEEVAACGAAAADGASRRRSTAPGSLRASAAAASAASAARASALAGSGVSPAAPGASAAPTEVDRLLLLPPYQARKELAKACMELELFPAALQLFDRLAEEDDADMEVAYLRGEAHHLAGDNEAASEVLKIAEDALSAAIARVEALAKRERGKKRAFAVPGTAAAYAADGLMALDLSELVSQRSMIRKLAAVVVAAGAGSAGVAAAGAAMPVDGGAE